MTRLALGVLLVMSSLACGDDGEPERAPPDGPAPRGACGGGQEITELADTSTVTQVNSVFCPAPGTQSVARCFESTLFPAGLDFRIDCVRFGVQTDASPAPYNLTIKLTLTPANGPDCSAVVGNAPAAWIANHTQTVLMPGALFSTISGLLRSGLIEEHRSAVSQGKDDVPTYRATGLGRRAAAARLAELSLATESDADSGRAMQNPGGGG